MLPCFSGRGISVQCAPPSADSIASSPHATIVEPAISAPEKSGNADRRRRTTLLCLRPSTTLPSTDAKLAPESVLRRSPVGPTSTTVSWRGASRAEGAAPPVPRIDQVSPPLGVLYTVPASLTA